MKNILSKLFMIVLFSGVFSVGCTDLEDKFEDAIDRDDVTGGGSNINPATALTAVYSGPLDDFTDQSNIYTILEHPTDEMMGPTRGTDWSDFGVFRQMHTHTWDASHSHILTAWNILNRGVFRTNEALTVLTDASAIAEAKYLRAFLMFYIVDLFGQVPLREGDADLNSIPDVLSRAEATDLIINELKAALPNLKSIDEVGVGRASKEAAHTLLAKVYLNKAVYTASNAAGPYTFSATDMDEVIANCDAVSANGKLQLEPNGEYWDIFSPDNVAKSSELIFTIDKKRGDGSRGGVNNRYFMTLHYNQNPSGWNGFTTIADFYDRWESTNTNDERKGKALPGVTDVSGLRVGFLEGQQYDKDGNALKDRSGAPLAFTKEVDLFYSTEVNGIRVIKYPPDYTDLNSPETDYIFFRYADVFLMKAEALWRKGDSGPALAMLNQLRNTRGSGDQNAISADGIELLNERGFEFYWEGWRRNDLIRFQKFTQPWTAKPQSPDHVVLFPIPQQALDTNPNLSQNPGY